MQDGPLHPWRMQTAVHHLKWRMHNWKSLYCKWICSTQSVSRQRGGWDMVPTMGDDAGNEIPLSLRRPLLWKDAQLLFPVQQCGTNTGRTHGLTYQRRWLPLRCTAIWQPPLRFIQYFPLQWQKVTLRSPQDSASTRSRCTQQGGAPQHRRASGGWPSDFLSMDDRNRLRGKRAGQCRTFQIPLPTFAPRA